MNNYEMSYNEAMELANKLQVLANEYTEKVNEKQDKPFMLGYYGIKMRDAIERLEIPKVTLDNNLG